MGRMLPFHYGQALGRGERYLGLEVWEEKVVWLGSGTAGYRPTQSPQPECDPKGTLGMHRVRGGVTGPSVLDSVQSESIWPYPTLQIGRLRPRGFIQ